MDEMRRAFEAWAQDFGWNAARLKPDGILNGVYKNATTQGLWRAWQAACAAEREWMLDLTYSYADSLSWNDDFQAAIRARSKQ